MITSAHAERMLMEFHGVDPWQPTTEKKAKTARSAFQERLKHLRRLGWPHGVNTGQGVRAQYSLNAVFQLVVGFELLQAGLVSDRMVHALTPIWQRVRQHLATAVVDPDRPYFLCFDPQVLVYYTPEVAPGVYTSTPSVEDVENISCRFTNDPALETFTGGWLEDIEEQLRRAAAEGFSRRFVVVCLTRLYTMVATWLVRHELAEAQALRSEILAWPEEDEAAEVKVARAYLDGRLDDDLRRLSYTCPESVEDAACKDEEGRRLFKAR